MRRILRARFLASALVVSVVPFVAAVPAQAQYRSDVSFDSFHDQLAQYGDWVYSDRWGLVWQPADVPDDFRPYYSGGRWAYTDAYGWTWASDYDWGDIAFHYGRWVDDPYDGWMWIPGYSWSPGWVVWRSNAHAVGWMPMPPDDQFLGGRSDISVGVSIGGVSIGWNDTSGDYGYSRWYGRDYDHRRFAANWTFVDTGHMADRDYRHVAYAPDRAVTIMSQTKNITNYTVVNNYAVNRSIDVHAVEQARGRPIVAVAATAVFKHPSSVITVDAGQKFRAREFDRAPHGTGIANSAPPPPAAVINKLSDHVAAHHAGADPALAGKPGAGPKGAGAPSHLFTKTTITAPAAATQFHGKPTAPAGATPAAVTPPTTGPQGLHAGPTVTAPVTKPVPGTTTAPNNGGATSLPGAKMHEQRSGGPATVTAPAATGSVPVAHPSDHKVVPAVTSPATQPVVKPAEHKLVAPTTEPVAKPITTPAVKPLDHKPLPAAAGPVTEPVAKPLEHKVTEPVAKPVTQSVVKPVEPKVVTPPVVHSAPPVVHTAPPVVHSEPPVVHSAPPAAEHAKPAGKPQEEKKKGDPKNKNE